jgi:hypothetical protein
MRWDKKGVSVRSIETLMIPYLEIPIEEGKTEKGSAILPITYMVVGPNDHASLVPNAIRTACVAANIASVPYIQESHVPLRRVR